MIDLLVRYLHFLGIFGVFATLVAEHLLVKKNMTQAEVRRFAKIDSIYGLCAIVTFIAGLALWLWVGKASGFYNKNWILHLKVSLFVVVGLLSIYPTVFFIRQRNVVSDNIDIPSKIVMMIRAELALLLVIPLLAVLMAQGVGL
jgi:putative membrane protein